MHHWEDPLEKEMAIHPSTLAWENPQDREAWWTTVHGVEDSRTQLSMRGGACEDSDLCFRDRRAFSSGTKPSPLEPSLLRLPFVRTLTLHTGPTWTAQNRLPISRPLRSYICKAAFVT